jgi:stringent starvation protein B
MLALLEQSGVFVHLDPRIQGVVVPDGFRRQPELVLQFGLNMAVAIKDLDVDDEAVSGTLSFARRPFWVKVPWNAVYALVSDEDQRGMVWPEDAPRESKLSQGSHARPRSRGRSCAPWGPTIKRRSPTPPATKTTSVTVSACSAAHLGWGVDRTARCVAPRAPRPSVLKATTRAQGRPRAKTPQTWDSGSWRPQPAPLRRESAPASRWCHPQTRRRRASRRRATLRRAKSSQRPMSRPLQATPHPRSPVAARRSGRRTCAW